MSRNTTPAVNSAAEVPQILQALDQGTVMIRFFRRKGNRPEKRILCLKMETFEILQYPMARGKLTQCEETSKQKDPAHLERLQVTIEL